MAFKKLYKKNITAFFLVFLQILFLSSEVCAKRRLIDQMGREVVIPDNPCRVIALAPSITEIVFAIGCQDRLIGATQFSDFPEQAEKLPKVGSYVHLDLEKIVSLKPDLCIATKDGNPKDVVNRLEALKIPVYAVNPKNLQTVMDTILETGRILCAEKAAEKTAANMKQRLKKIKELVKKAEKKPGVFFQIGIAPIVSVGTKTYIHELIVLAGGINLSQGNTTTAYPRYSMEQVIGLAPDVIIITSMARGAVFERVKARWSRWSELPAVKNKSIFLVDSNLFDRPAPRLINGLELLVKLIHPELYLEP